MRRAVAWVMKYVRRKLLGKGAMGEVYTAGCESGEEVAVKHVRKTLAMDRAVVERFANESRLLGRVMHDNALDAALVGEALNATVQLAPADVTTELADLEDLTIRRMPERATLVGVALPIHVQEMIRGTLERAGRLIDAHDLRAAVTELEYGLAKLVRDPHTNTLEGEAWRIETVLAALHAALGRKQVALRIALAAQQRAIALDCVVAKNRTTSLVERLQADTPRPRLARGSGRFTGRPRSSEE